MFVKKEILFICEPKELSNYEELIECLSAKNNVLAVRKPVVDFDQPGYFATEPFSLAILVGYQGRAKTSERIESDLKRIRFVKDSKYQGLIFIITSLAGSLQEYLDLYNIDNVRTICPVFNGGKLYNSKNLADHVTDFI